MTMSAFDVQFPCTYSAFRSELFPPSTSSYFFLAQASAMEDQEQQQDETHRPNHGSESTDERKESVRSRWTPKPEQILILESIFNSGMVNPPKEETVRIRKLLEKYGSVGDANVFYWFQNRRSRSRRRQRQIQQASLCAEKPAHTRDGGAIQRPGTSSCPGFPQSAASSYPLVGSSSVGGTSQNDFANNMISAFPAQMGHHIKTEPVSSSAASVLCPSNITHNLHFQSGFITVFINGVATEIPRGPIDPRAMFGQDYVLFHSSGVPVPVNDYGFLLEEGLQQGESYFLVHKTA